MSAIVSSVNAPAVVPATELPVPRHPAVETSRAAPPPAERGLEVRVDAGTGITVISVVDRSTGEVVRQIPEDVVIRIARYLDAELGGQGAIDTSA